MLKGIDLLKDELNKTVKTQDDLTLKNLIKENKELEMFLRAYNKSPKEAIVNLDEMYMLKLVQDEMLKEKLLYIKRTNDTEYINNNLNDLNNLKNLVIKRSTENNKQIKSLNTNEISYYLLKKINDKEIISSKDYYLIDNFINEAFTNEKLSDVKDQIYTSINLLNADKFKTLYIMPKEEITKDPEIKETKIEEKEIIKREKLEVKEEIEETSFDHIEIKENKKEEKHFKHKQNKIANKSLDDILTLLKINKQDIPKIYLMKLNTLDKLTINQKYNILNENNIINILRNNVNALIYLLTVPSVNDIERMLFIIKTNSKNNYSTNLRNILLNATYIFNKKEGENFTKNLILIKKYGIDFNYFIKNNPLFLFSDNDKIKHQIKIIEKNNYPTKKILLNSSISLISYENESELSFFEENIEILKNFSVELPLYFNESEEVFGLLNYKPSSLVKRLIFLIELSLTNEIYNNYNHLGTSMKSFIIKRLHYAYKNSIPTFDEFDIELSRILKKPFVSKEFNTSNFTRKTYLEHKDKIKREVKYNITEQDIVLLKHKYPALDLLDEQHRPSIFSKTKLALVKRKQELVMGNQIISRVKFFSLFNYFINEYDLYTSMFLSIIDDSILEEFEYDYILNKISEYQSKHKEIEELYTKEIDHARLSK